MTPAPDETLQVLIADGAVVLEHGGEVEAPWWSFTKTLIAAAVMRLAEAGEVELDTVADTRGFTARQVMRHEAGLPDYGGLPAYHQAVAAGEPPWPVAEILARTNAERLVFPPGQGWAYSNIGYLWLRELIEQRRGPDALAELVLKPLGLETARLALTPEDLDGARMGSAAGYHPAWVYHGLAVGPLREAALALDRLPGLLTAQSLAAMRQATPLPQANRPPWRLAAYGAGAMTPVTATGAAVFGHTGGGPGSGIAVYRLETRTAAVFALDETSYAVEGPAVAMLEP